MKLQKLVKSVRVFESLSQSKVNVKLAYKIMKILSETKDDVEFYQTKAKDIIDKYSIKEEGKLKQNDRGIYLDPSKQNEFNNEFDELNNTEANTPNIKFMIDEFQEIKVSASELLAIEEFLC